MKKDNVGVWQGIYQETHARNGREEVKKGNIRVWQDIYTRKLMPMRKQVKQKLSKAR